MGRHNKQQNIFAATIATTEFQFKFTNRRSITAAVLILTTLLTIFCVVDSK